MGLPSLMQINQAYSYKTYRLQDGDGRYRGFRRISMRYFRNRLVAAAALAAAVSLSTSAHALPTAGVDGLRPAVNGASIVEEAQYVRNGRRYCWYDDGWNSAGWYRCGYAWRRGQGWGGHHGWHGWGRPDPGSRYYHGYGHHGGRGCCW